MEGHAAGRVSRVTARLLRCRIGRAAACTAGRIKAAIAPALNRAENRRVFQA